MKYYKLIFQIMSLIICQDIFSQEISGYKITKLTDGIYELITDGGGYPLNVIASVGADGLLIIDSGDKEHGDSLVKALQTFKKGMPKIIINTHSHIEHIGGNITIGSGPTIIGHKNLRDRYINGLYVFTGIPESVLPNITFSDSMNLYFNGEEIRLMAFPGAHDNSDIIVWFMNSKIVCTGALCNGHHFPSIDGETGDITKYPETVAKVFSILPEDILIVPGHADDCTIKEYKQFYDMLIQTSDIIRTGLTNGKSLEELKEEDILSDWMTWESYVDRNSWIQYWVKAIQYPKVISTKKKIYAPVYHTMLQEGVDSAIVLYNTLKTKQSDQYFFEEETALWIGRVLAYIGKDDEAAKFLNLCINENPNRDAAFISHYILGNLNWGQGNLKSSKEHYEKYLERFPKDEIVLERMKEVDKEK
jgi:cyclase